MHGRPKADRKEVAALLLRFIHDELMRNVRDDVQRQQGSPPTETTLEDLVRDRDWLFEGENYHADTTHLQSIVRFGVVLDDPELIRLAYDLTQYGVKLGDSYQFPGRPPFIDVYPDHARYYAALLGRNVDEAVAYFKQQADDSVEDQDTTPVDVYLSLLSRLGRTAEAIEETARLQPPGKRQSDLAPSLQELAQQSGDYERLMKVSRARGDLLGFAAGLTAKTSGA
jgi:hypothetical protein